MSYFATLLIALYGTFCFVLLYQWWAWPDFRPLNFIEKRRRLTVIIPVRNEAANIENLLKDLNSQTLNKWLFEVIIADDDSTDNTVEIVKKLQSTLSIDLKINQLPPRYQNTSPKKRAITETMKMASGEIIVCTDGDCRVGANWLMSISNYFEAKQPVFLSSPVYFLSPHNELTFFQRIWVRLQQIEFASLIVSGAVSIKMGYPNMCSGANIAYQKSAFKEVRGFEGNEHIASGDDEFLMHKMAKEFKGRVHYLKSKEAIVLTNALSDLKSFYYQRKRWAGKWSHYTSFAPKAMAAFIFLCNTALVYAFVTGNFYLAFIKLWPEFLFLGGLLLFFKSASNLILVPFLQVIYPFYVLFFGLSSLDKKTYTWKNRKLK
ncbi:glycosyltransferase [Jiulongibacter sediminis]|uniref:glycosyltransferase n=1 Tax=Jiulongibacter sediminis TaxID=1605367 RepID=UPI000A90DBD7|nr:glycosyltransferase [Jiulongibacter sediminis]TBX27106.1 hypothetical protein TK44_00780 [Jiulongibacter sediminis]